MFSYPKIVLSVYSPAPIVSYNQPVLCCILMFTFHLRYAYSFQLNVNCPCTAAVEVWPLVVIKNIFILFIVFVCLYKRLNASGTK